MIELTKRLLINSVCTSRRFPPHVHSSAYFFHLRYSATTRIVGTCWQEGQPMQQRANVMNTAGPSASKDWESHHQDSAAGHHLPTPPRHPPALTGTTSDHSPSPARCIVRLMSM
ncbi:hypothetical protein CEXT_312301 [Caerostris extrusa]|uniref:Uncharacterized protein n=1 Tax=Caerostris extrusa TaxID=172846 RepID=A0AAV4UWS9_CAEEX|nr:hypothetical protein CEXT_312301 [Caerostris extrusa]